MTYEHSASVISRFIAAFSCRSVVVLLFFFFDVDIEMMIILLPDRRIVSSLDII